MISVTRLIRYLRHVLSPNSQSSVGLVLRDRLRPEVVGIGSEPHGQRPGKVPRHVPWGYR